MKASLKNSGTKTRFAFVGVANTIIDFGVLFSFTSFGLPVASANILSTTAAFCFSFFANKKYTFKTSGTNIKREIVLFVIVTLFGLWVLQTIVIQLVLALIGTALTADLALIGAKVCAVLVSLTWNYFMYSRVVFKNP